MLSFKSRHYHVDDKDNIGIKHDFLCINICGGGGGGGGEGMAGPERVLKPEKGEGFNISKGPGRYKCISDEQNVCALEL